MKANCLIQRFLLFENNFQSGFKVAANFEEFPDGLKLWFWFVLVFLFFFSLLSLTLKLESKYYEE